MNLEKLFSLMKKKGYLKLTSNKNKNILFMKDDKNIRIEVNENENDNAITINNKTKHHQLTDDEIFSILKFLKK